MDNIVENIVIDFGLDDYGNKKLLLININETNYKDKLFSSFLSYKDEYKKVLDRTDVKLLLDKYIFSDFSLPRFLLNKIFNDSYVFDSLKEYLTILIPYMKESNDLFRKVLTRSFVSFTNNTKSNNKEKIIDYEILNTIIEHDKLDFTDEKYIHNVIIPLICRGEIDLLECLGNKKMIKIDRTCIQKCLYYGRNIILEYLVENYEIEIKNLIDENILGWQHVWVVDDIWGGLWFGNDECDKPLINKDVEHIKTFNILKNFCKRWEIYVKYTPEYFKLWYLYCNTELYSIGFIQLLQVFEISFEKSREAIKEMHNYVKDKNMLMGMIKDYFSSVEIIDMLLE
jgi:hypothetical protein